MIESSSKKFSEDLVKYIVSRIAGTHHDDEITPRRPSDYFIIGSLAAPRQRDLLLINDDIDKASIRAQRLKISFLVNKNKITENSEIFLQISGNVFFQIKDEITQNNKNDEINDFHDEETEREEKTQKWKRIQFTDDWIVKFYEINQTKFQKKDIDFSKIVNEANSDPSIKHQINSNVWKGELSTQIDDFNETDYIFTVYFKNCASEPDKKDNYDRTFFDCRLRGKINGDFINEFSDEYFYEGKKQRYFYNSRTINCQANWDIERKIFWTDHFGFFEQENIRPRASLPGINLNFNNLTKSESTLIELEKLLKLMRHKYEIFVNNIPDNNGNFDFQPRDGDKQKTWGERKELVNHYNELINRVAAGIDLLKNDPSVRESFLKTNETFNNYYSTKKIHNAGWRIFQLIFLLSSLESTVKETKLDVVDVLHVDTGGGKSEAYFALVVFTSFFERSRGKREGVTAIVKFPLRMLSIQQLERLSGILIHAEQVRKKYSILYPGEDFSLGYYVGNTDEFPDLYKKVRDTLFNKKELKTPSPESIIISNCPVCQGEPQGSMRLYDEPKHARIVHRCDKCGFEFHLYISDREIFRWRPTVIVSTVDKWAALSQQRRIRSLLGGRGSQCPESHGFIPSGDICEDNQGEAFQCENTGKNELSVNGPRLSILDEMHLLKEEFGTISSHFEGLIETICESTSGRSLKHIAMSATLNGTKKQIDEMYKKSTFIIPGRCPEGIGSSTDIFFEKIEGQKRIIYGFKPNLRDNHYGALRSLLHYSEFIIQSQNSLNSNPNHFCDTYSLPDEISAQNLINQFLIPLTYHIKKQDAIDMLRLKDAVIGDILERKFHVGITSKVLTGDSNLEFLKKAIDDVRSYLKRYTPKEIQNGKITFEQLHATSVVSHGVDLEELNFMVFQGLPYSTSEYIQALSRVGRKDLGIVLLWFYPNRVRDDSFYRNFKRYHDTLDHQVRPIPIKRYSRLGLYQTINSMFCSSLLCYLSNEKGKPLYKKEHIKALNIDEKNQVVEFIKKVYKRGIIDINIDQEVEDRFNHIIQSPEPLTTFFPTVLVKSGNFFYRNQSGMRGIQKQLIVELVNQDKHLILKGRN